MKNILCIDAKLSLLNSLFDNLYTHLADLLNYTLTKGDSRPFFISFYIKNSIQKAALLVYFMYHFNSL